MLQTRLLRSFIQASTSISISTSHLISYPSHPSHHSYTNHSHPTQIPHIRPYSSNSDSKENPDFEAARQWFKTFNATRPAENEGTGVLPSTKIATTEYSRASGPGGQKVNKTSSKATTAWPLHALLKYVPRALHQGLRDSGYYVASSDSIKISCDSNRTQSANREETHARFCAEIEKIYRRTIPGVTSEEQKGKVSELKALRDRLRNSVKLGLDSKTSNKIVRRIMICRHDAARRSRRGGPGPKRG